MSQKQKENYKSQITNFGGRLEGKEKHSRRKRKERRKEERRQKRKQKRQQKEELKNNKENRKPKTKTVLCCVCMQENDSGESGKRVSWCSVKADHLGYILCVYHLDI